MTWKEFAGGYIVCETKTHSSCDILTREEHDLIHGFKNESKENKEMNDKESAADTYGVIPKEQMEKMRNEITDILKEKEVEKE